MEKSGIILLELQRRAAAIQTDSLAKATPHFVKAGGAAGVSIGCAATAKYFVDSVLLARILVISSGILGCGSALALTLAFRILNEAADNFQETIQIRCELPVVKKEMCNFIALELDRREKKALVRDGNARFSQHNRRIDAQQTGARAHARKTDRQGGEILTLKSENVGLEITVHGLKTQNGEQGAIIQEQGTEIRGLKETLEVLMGKFARLENQQEP